MKKMILFAGLILALCTLGGTAHAFLFLGGPLDGNSWGQRFEESGVGMFDFVRVDWISGAYSFETPVFRNFSNGGWSEAWAHPEYAAAAGPEVSNLQFDIWFEGPNSAPLSFQFTAYRGENALESAVAMWDGNWHFTASSAYPEAPHDDPAPPVPEPASVLLIGAGVGAIGIVRRIRKKS